MWTLPLITCGQQDPSVGALAASSRRPMLTYTLLGTYSEVQPLWLLARAAPPCAPS